VRDGLEAPAPARVPEAPGSVLADVREPAKEQEDVARMPFDELPGDHDWVHIPCRKWKARVSPRGKHGSVQSGSHQELRP
jgi:hypothetical protein